MNTIAARWVNALARQDFDTLNALLAPDVQFRALVPGETVNATSAAEAVASFRRWFGDKTDVEIIDQHADVLIDRLQVRFRARVRKKGQAYLVEQSLCGDVEGGRFATLDLLCAGFRPEGVVAADESRHLFDAGDLGCGTGLPREFRARLAQIPVGHVLEVITSDPSAREDLPALARMLGHQVRSIEPDADGKLRIQVERAQ